MNDSALITDPHAGVLGISYSTSPELLRQCIASGQVEASAIVAHGCAAHGLAHPCEACAEEWAADQDRSAGVAPLQEPKGNRCGCSWWLTKPCPARNCPWQGKRPVDAGVQEDRNG